MTLPTFNPPISPSPGFTDTPEVKVIVAEFGDGYTQATRAGLNHIRRVISARWDVLTPEQAVEILGFFKERGGDRPFFYTIPGEDEAVKLTCKEWTSTRINGGYVSIDANFRQSFNITADA